MGDEGKNVKSFDKGLKNRTANIIFHRKEEIVADENAINLYVLSAEQEK